MRIFLLIIIATGFSSCATLLNEKKTVVVLSTEATKVIVHNDTLPVTKGNTRLVVDRSKEPLDITLLNDSITRHVSVPSKNSFTYKMNASYPSFWIGFLIDRKNPKRYTYPDRIYVDIYDSSNSYSLYGPKGKKGILEFHYSFPYINSFLLKPENEETKANTGFWGLTLGFDYYYDRSKFVSVSASAVLDFFIPFPAPFDISGEYDGMNSKYIACANNHRIGKFMAGYGLSLSRNTWAHRYSDRFNAPPPLREPVKKSNTALGLYFPMYYQIGDYFFAGIVYRPSMIRFSSDSPFLYEHLISLDFGWKFRL